MYDAFDWITLNIEFRILYIENFPTENKNFGWNSESGF